MTAGQFLLRIDPVEAQEALARTRADVQDAQAELRDAERALVLGQDELPLRAHRRPCAIRHWPARLICRRAVSGQRQRSRMPNWPHRVRRRPRHHRGDRRGVAPGAAVGAPVSQGPHRQEGAMAC